MDQSHPNILKLNCTPKELPWRLHHHSFKYLNLPRANRLHKRASLLIALLLALFLAATPLPFHLAMADANAEAHDLFAAALSSVESQQPQPRPRLWAKNSTKLRHVVDAVHRLRDLQSQMPPRRSEGLKTDLGVGIAAGMTRRPMAVLEMSNLFINSCLGVAVNPQLKEFLVHTVLM
jgi:hypothetical protein